MAEYCKGKAVLHIHEFYLIAYKFLEVIYSYFTSLLSPEGKIVAKGERNFQRVQVHSRLCHGNIYHYKSQLHDIP